MLTEEEPTARDLPSPTRGCPPPPPTLSPEENGEAGGRESQYRSVTLALTLELTLNFPQLPSPGPERLAGLVQAADSETLSVERCHTSQGIFMGDWKGCEGDEEGI